LKNEKKKERKGHSPLCKGKKSEAFQQTRWYKEGVSREQQQTTLMGVNIYRAYYRWSVRGEGNSRYRTHRQLAEGRRERGGS